MYNRIIAEGVERPSPVAKSFPKREIMIKDSAQLKFSDPRIIQGCAPELVLATGRFVRRAAKNLRQGLRPRTQDDWRHGRQVVYTCGLDNAQIGNEFAKALTSIERSLEPGERVVILEDDQSRFDLHLIKPAFVALQSLYGSLLPRKVARLLRRTEHSRGRTCLGTVYSVPYTMQSGWPDTSYGDSLANALMKYEVHGVGRRWISIICGDDSVTVMVDTDLKALGGVEGVVAAYAAFGMEVEALVADNPLDTGFCSGRFMPCGESFILVPKTGKMIAKSGSDLSRNTGVAGDEWMRGVATGLVTFGRQDPLLGALGYALLRGLGAGKCRFDRDMEWKMQSVSSVVVPIADYLTYMDHHYNMSERDVLELIQVLGQLREGEVLTHPLVRRMCEVDLGPEA